GAETTAEGGDLHRLTSNHCRSATQSNVYGSLGMTDAEQMVFAAQKHLPTADRRRGETFFSEFVARHSFELRAGSDDVHHSIIVEKIDQTARGHQGGMLLSQTLFPKQSPGGGFETMRHTGIRGDQKITSR